MVDEPTDDSTGPFIFAPISELWGRQTAYLSSQALFIVFSAGCVAAQR